MRYVRIYQLSEPSSWRAPGDVKHARIWKRSIAGDERAAQDEMAHHLSRKVLRVLTDCAADYPPSAVPHTVTLINRISPVARHLGGAV